MNMISPAETESKRSSLKVKGRILLQEEFSSRLQSMCNGLGFEDVKIRERGECSSLDTFSDTVHNCSEKDAVIILSCKVYYNPNWGGFSGHPQLLTRVRTGKDELCPDGFLAPFMQLYKLAQKRIYLTKTRQGRHLITCPKEFLNQDEKSEESKLLIALDKVAEPDRNGVFVPISISDSRFSYTISANLRQALDAQHYDWKSGKSMPIGRYLSSDMFFFTCAKQTAAPDDPFYSTLFPHLQQLVTHRTPHLRAAEIHLHQEFCQQIAILNAERPATSPKLLCLAGLDIDMAPFAGHGGEKYFVPWMAYMKGVDGNSSKRCSLDQDDLFVRLMQ